MTKFYIPVLGIKYYLDTFGPTGRKDGPKAVLFAFWMAFYQGGLCLGAPIGLLTSLILNQ
jgi:hypothetical protein